MAQHPSHVLVDDASDLHGAVAFGLQRHLFNTQGILGQYITQTILHFIPFTSEEKTSLSVQHGNRHQAGHGAYLFQARDLTAFLFLHRIKLLDAHQTYIQWG